MQALVNAGQVLDKARPLLNDTSGQEYTNQVLLPYLQMAYEDLSNRLIRHGVQYIKDAESIASMPQGSEQIQVPQDLITPDTIDQRASASEAWYPLPQGGRVDPPDTETNVDTVSWIWREGTILLSSPLPEAREFFLRYKRSLAPLTRENSPVEVPNAGTALAYQTAGLVKEHVMHNPIEAAGLYDKFDKSLNDIIGIETKAKQALPGRRRRLGYTRIDGGFGRVYVNPNSLRRL